ncbi:MAG: response regulator transcription factor [Chloroflexota bacterium]|nr:response regulator transcription factor [Chloroflexota bacterium]MDE2886399.1 response regulator transcription factor [Chloroflexota bacterium]
MVDASPFRDHAAAWRAEITVGILYDARTPSTELIESLDREGVQFGPADDVTSPHAFVLDLVDVDRRRAESMSGAYVKSLRPVIAVLSRSHLEAPDLSIAADDFIIAPWEAGELALRINKLLERKAPADDPGVIRVGDLVINPSRYDVFLAGRPVVLAFKEYELLKLMAANPGRVYSRETLLEQVWGYQYFGGTRTVDVHIRRLRSKIEDASHTFIDTVWNVGYRFRG